MGIRAICEAALNGEPTAWFAPAHKYATEAWAEIVERLKPIADMPGGRISQQEKRIVLPKEVGGGSCEVWSLLDNEDAGRGRSYGLVVVDEAGLIGNLATIWEASIKWTLMDRQGKSLLLGTPKGARTPFNVMFNQAASGEKEGWAAFHGKTIDNTMVPGLVAEVEQARKDAERNGTMALFLQEAEGVPADDGSNPIGLNAIDACVAPASERPTVAWGVDLARSVDFTVAIGFDVFGRWTEVHRFQHDWGRTKRELLNICGTVTPVLMDATGVGSPIVQDLYHAGMNVNGFVFSKKTRGTLIEDLITAFHGKRLTIPEGWLQWELQSLGVEYNSETGFMKYSVPDGAHDDGIMALALAWRCYSHEAPMPEWETEKRELPWLADEDGTRILESDADAEFSGLGDGW